MSINGDSKPPGSGSTVTQKRVVLHIVVWFALALIPQYDSCFDQIQTQMLNHQTHLHSRMCNESRLILIMYYTVQHGTHLP